MIGSIFVLMSRIFTAQISALSRAPFCALEEGPCRYLRRRKGNCES